MEEGRDKFWEKAFLGDFAGDCVHHVILPTLLSTRCTTWIKTKKLMDKDGENVYQAQRYNMFCTYCNAYLAGEQAKVGVRFLLGKQRTAPGVFAYKAAFGSAPICMACCDAESIVNHVNSNVAMERQMYARLDTLARDICEASTDSDISGEEFLSYVIYGFTIYYDEFLAAIAKIDPRCEACNKKAPKKCCSRCHYTHYCNVECATAHWVTHKSICNVFVKKEFFYQRVLK